MTAVSLIHREYRLDRAGREDVYRGIGLLPDGQVAVLAQAEGTDEATLEFAFGLEDARFYASRILAGDLGAARRPGMSRMLAAALLVSLKAGLASGAIAPVGADEGSGDG